MGTRAIINVKDGNKTMVTIYRQYDGYPAGLGKDIFDALASRKLVNGFSDVTTQVNGIGCAAALLICALKKNEAGNVYILSPNETGWGEQYRYTLSVKDGALHLVCSNPSASRVIYSGPLADFNSADYE